MSDDAKLSGFHSHTFLGEGHEKSERKTWAVIWLCSAMMIAEIVGGLLFGSIALVADGLHMSTHAGALLLAALAYTYARKHADNPIFTFSTGKLGDLAGFTSAIILAMIALLIACESVMRLFEPVAIHFAEAIPIACLGLAVNIASAWLLSGSGHHHGHGEGDGDGHAHDGDGHADVHHLATDGGIVALEVFEHGVPPRFRLRAESGPALTGKQRQSKRCAPMARGRCSRCRTWETIWNRSTKYPSRTPSRPICGLASATIPLLSKSMSTPMKRRAATTTCGPPSSTSWPMPPYRCW